MAFYPNFAVNSLIDGDSQAAADRISQGVAKVRRESNALRTFGVTFEHLGKLNPINAGHLQDLIECFGTLIESLDARPVHILGLAESGIIPSFAMHQACFVRGQSSLWKCSTRANTSLMRFEEPHSHAPEHFLPPTLFDTSAEELWIVEDEITSGKTLDNLLECIGSRCKNRPVRIFSMLETRDTESLTNFYQRWKQRDIDISSTSILTADPSFWSADLVVGQPTQKCALPESLSVGESIASALPRLIAGDIQCTQHVTLSPWMVDGHSIISRQHHRDGYYLYNV